MKELNQQKDGLEQSVQKYETMVAELAQDKLRWTAELATKEAHIKKLNEQLAKKQSEIEEETALRDQILLLVKNKK